MCFVASESETMYRIAVSQFKDLVMGDARVEVFLTDDDTSLRNALAVFYPNTPQLLCIWHVNKNVETKVNTTWGRSVPLPMMQTRPTKNLDRNLWRTGPRRVNKTLGSWF